MSLQLFYISAYGLDPEKTSSTGYISSPEELEANQWVLIRMGIKLEGILRSSVLSKVARHIGSKKKTNIKSASPDLQQSLHAVFDPYMLFKSL